MHSFAEESRAARADGKAEDIDKAKESLRLINEGTIPKLQNASHAAAHGHGVQCLITL